MRLLHVVHGFLPESLGGAEIYARSLAAAQARAGDAVAVLARSARPDRVEYDLRRERDGALCVHRLNVTFAAPRDWSGLYLENARVDAAAARVMDEVRPDAVHVHHLSGLSLGLPAQARARGIPVVYTLHDYWYLCPRGQMVRPDLARSDGPEPHACAACLAPELAAEEDARPGLWRSLLDLAPAAPRVRWALEGEALDGLYAHPPSSHRFAVDVPPRGAVLAFAVGLDPSVWTAAHGEGVRFAVRVDGTTAWEALIDPKRRPADRRWHRASVALAPAARPVEIELVTEPESPRSNLHNQAAWGDPRAGTPREARLEERGRGAREELSQARALVAPSATVWRRYAAWGIPRERLLQVDYGFERARFDGFARQGGPGLRVGFLGTLVPSKGAHVLVDAFARAALPGARLRLWGRAAPWPGSSGYADDLARAARVAGAEVRQPLPPERIAEAFAEMDVLVVPSLWDENSPLTIHEAFLTATPVVASDLGGMAELVRDGDNGLLFPAGDAAALAACLRRLHADAALRARLARPTPVRDISEDVALWRGLYVGR